MIDYIKFLAVPRWSKFCYAEKVTFIFCWLLNLVLIIFLIGLWSNR